MIRGCMSEAGEYWAKPFGSEKNIIWNKPPLDLRKILSGTNPNTLRDDDSALPSMLY